MHMKVTALNSKGLYHYCGALLARGKVIRETDADLKDGCGRDKEVRIDVYEQDDCSHTSQQPFRGAGRAYTPTGI